MNRDEKESVVEAIGLEKFFKDFWGRPKTKALNGVSFSVKRGEVFGLLGPNGSGKSTTIKILLGLLYPTKGRVAILENSPRHVKSKSLIGYLPEETYLYKHLSAEETLDFFASLFKYPKAERKRRIDQLLEMVGLEHARKRPIGEFSKGMARRIGIAQALINDPDLIILDEPTSGLDPIGCKEVKDLISTLAKRGKTIILCSHLLSDVEDVCDYAMVLYGGKIRAEGPLDRLLMVEERTRITTPQLDRHTMDKVLHLLNESCGADNVVLDHPTLGLEEFFLNVVKKAQQDHVASAGAHKGGHVAGYLNGDHVQKDLKLVEEITEYNHESDEDLELAATMEIETVAAAEVEKMFSELPTNKAEKILTDLVKKESQQEPSLKHEAVTTKSAEKLRIPKPDIDIERINNKLKHLT